MTIQLLIIGSVFLCVACLVGGIAILAYARAGSAQIEDRLANLTKNRGRGGKAKTENASILAKPLEETTNQIEAFLVRTLDVGRLLEQAGMTIPPLHFLGVSAAVATMGTSIYVIFSPLKALAPIVFLFFLAVPLIVVLFKRKKRLRVFSGQLADAMDMMSRALRSGYSLPAGIQLVGQQMSGPLGPEFMRCYEQQNLGVPLEQSIREMTERVPNVDLQFFATAVILQRQTGGDLAEILDKIGSLIRERFKIWGQIKALTGEGRLSGIVLLALPPFLFLVMLRLNYDYVMMLFHEPLGRKMLIAGIITQLVGALVIKKIVTIKV